MALSYAEPFKRWKKGGLDSLHTHSVQQAIRQVSQKGINKQEESVSKKHQIYLLQVEHHIVQYWKQTQSEGNSKKDG